MRSVLGLKTSRDAAIPTTLADFVSLPSGVTLKVPETKKKRVLFFPFSLCHLPVHKKNVRYVDLYLSCFPFLPVRHWRTCVQLM